MPRCGRRRKHIPDDIWPLASVCERRLRVIFVRRKIVENLTRRKIISVPCTARSASRTWWFVVVSLQSPAISMHFSFVKNSICWERVKKDGNSKFCSEMYPLFYWEEQCSELNPYCTVETNFPHRFCVNVLCNDLIGPFIFECRWTADMFLQFLQNGLPHLFR